LLPPEVTHFVRPKPEKVLVKPIGVKKARDIYAEIGQGVEDAPEPILHDPEDQVPF
jgi:hypothetical protein